ncbi:MAG: TolC family protein [Lachnospiraceae bacterium]
MMRRWCAAILVIVLIASMILPQNIWAAGPVATKVNTGYDEETWNRLQDNCLEYDEIPLLVHEYNSTISDIWENLEDAQTSLLDSVEELESQERKMKDLKDSAKNSGQVMDEYNYTIQEGALAAISSGMKNSGLQSINSKSTLASIQRAEDQITQAAQYLMISYDTLRKQQELTGHLEALYEAQYRLASARYAQGMATTADVLSAETSMLSAQSSRQSIESALLQLKPMLCTLTGWPADADLVIAAIPSVDMGRIAEMNLEEDTKKAIGNNTTMMELRRSEAGKTMDGTAARLALIEEGEQNVTLEMQRLYDDVSAKKAAYETSLVGYQCAQKDKEGYDRMYQLGMLAQVDYLGAEISYYQKKAACEAADLSLRLSIETYFWAVRGFASI